MEGNSRKTGSVILHLQVASIPHVYGDNRKEKNYQCDWIGAGIVPVMLQKSIRIQAIIKIGRD